MAEKPKYLFGEMYIVSADAELKVFNHMTGILKEIESNKDDMLVSRLIKYVDNYKTRLKELIKQSEDFVVLSKYLDEYWKSYYVIDINDLNKRIAKMKEVLKKLN